MPKIHHLFTGRIRSYGAYQSAIDKDERRSITVTEDGIRGDQAAHEFHGGPNRAVHQLPSEHYTDWKLPVGHLGENLSSTGMFESTVCIGDRWRFGEVVLEVSQPRAPCFKTSQRSGYTNFAEILDLNQVSGWFYRVITPGVIEPGVEPLLLSRPYSELTVKQVHQLANLDLFPKSDEFLQRCMNCPELDGYWKQLITGDPAKVVADREARLGLDQLFKPPPPIVWWWLVCGIATWWILTM